jgi:hypothetical protein
MGFFVASEFYMDAGNNGFSMSPGKLRHSSQRLVLKCAEQNGPETSTIAIPEP